MNRSIYADTIDYLYGLQKHGIKLGLDNPRLLMSLMGEPQKSFRSVHVGGTNGKGSTSHMIAAILRNSGFNVGLYTSPHLVSFTERVKINGTPISESDIVRLASFVRESVSGTSMNPTFFEFVTAMAFYYFASSRVDWAVVEVGMGGRLDATNVLLPEVSIITNIGLEHKEFLGESIAEIAFEKAGIIKPSVPVVTASATEALEVIKNAALPLNSEVHVFGRDFKASPISMSGGRTVFDYFGSASESGAETKYSSLTVPASGRHQITNASIAIRTCELLNKRDTLISGNALRDGLMTADFSGRLEWISRTPPVIIDSAHNPDAASALASAMKEMFPEKKIIMIAGIMKDKDISGILKPLTGISDTIILTRPQGERAASPEMLKEAIEKIHGEKNKISIKITYSVADAVSVAKTLLNDNSIILVTGSFYTTGEAKEIFGQKGVLSKLRE